MMRQQKTLRLSKKKKKEKERKKKKEKRGKKAAFKRKYQESYVNYGFIATKDLHSPSLLCIICSDWLSNKAMGPLKLLCHMETKNPALKDKTLEVFK